ncbi:hypothetical protein MWH03_00140 [Klebsiella pneumoniae]|nr:hypothetical protein [Klebsiella pneumoniae]
MTNLLDLDAIKPSEKSIKLKGKKYYLNPMSLGLFVLIQQLQEKDISSQPLVEQAKAYADIIEKFAPGMPREAIDTLSIEQLQQIFVFATATADQISERATPEEAK